MTRGVAARDACSTVMVEHIFQGDKVEGARPDHVGFGVDHRRQMLAVSQKLPRIKVDHHKCTGLWVRQPECRVRDRLKRCDDLLIVGAILRDQTSHRVDHPRMKCRQ